MMIGVDTNILMRFALNDDPRQTPLVQARLRRAVEQGETLYISPGVLMEGVWIINKRGGRADVAAFVSMLLKTPPFRLFDAALVDKALSDFAKGQAGFQDYLIAAMNRAAGCAATLTLDEKALAHPHFRSISD